MVILALKVVPHETTRGLFWVVFEGHDVDGPACRLVIQYRREPEDFGRTWKVDLDSRMERRPVEAPQILDELKPLIREAVRRYLFRHEECEVLGSVRIPGGNDEGHRHHRP